MPSRLLAILLPCATFFSLVFPGAGAPAGEELSPAESTALLEQLHELQAKEPNFQASFTEERTSHLLNKPVTSEGLVYFSLPDKFRWEVRTPSPSTTVIDGRTMWIYYPAFNEVEIYSPNQRSFFSESLAALTAPLSFEHLDEYYNFHAYREGSGYRLDLTPKKPSVRRVVEQISLELNGDLLPVHTEISLPKGDHLSTEYHNPRRPSLPASLFEFTPPAGAHVTRPMGK